jgi:MFS family permease
MSIFFSNDPDRTPLQMSKIYSLTFALFSTSIVSTMVFSFYSFMVHDLIKGTEAEVGYYAGFLPGCYYFTQVFSSLFAGYWADKHGRRPFILIGMAGSLISTLFFGFSPNFAWAIIARSFGGLLDVNWVLGRCYIGDITDATNRNYGFSFLSLAWSSGTIIGPLLGGYLSQPVEKYPYIFENIELFKRFPYSLPCIVSAAITFVALIVSYFYLTESMNTINESKIKEDIIELIENNDPESNIKENTESNIKDNPQENIINDFLKLLKSITPQEYKNVLLAITFYIAFQFLSATFDELLPIFALLTKKDDGLSWTTSDVGNCYLIAGIIFLVYNLFFQNYIMKKIKAIGALKLGYMLCAIICFLFPFQSLWTNSIIIQISIFSLFTIRILSGNWVFSANNVLINNASPKGTVGRVNGIAYSLGALLKAIGPSVGGTVFAWSIARGLHFPFNYNFVYNVLSIISLILFFLIKFIPKDLNM